MPGRRSSSSEGRLGGMMRGAMPSGRSSTTKVQGRRKASSTIHILRCFLIQPSWANRPDRGKKPQTCSHKKFVRKPPVFLFHAISDMRVGVAAIARLHPGVPKTESRRGRCRPEISRGGSRRRHRQNETPSFHTPLTHVLCRSSIHAGISRQP